jgi:hypothetical protein
MWRTRLIVRPGQKGSKSLQNKYGSRLLCVRYRYNKILDRRQKTVELLEEEVDWKHKSRKVFIRVTFKEVDVRNKLRKAGGIWIPEKQLWEIPLIKACELGLKGRIIKK